MEEQKQNNPKTVTSTAGSQPSPQVWGPEFRLASVTILERQGGRKEKAEEEGPKSPREYTVRIFMPPYEYIPPSDVLAMETFETTVKTELPAYHSILTHMYKGDKLFEKLQSVEKLAEVMAESGPDARIEACVTKTLPELEKKTNIDMDDQQDVANLTECLLCYALAFWLRPDSVSKLKGVALLLKRERERLENETKVDWV